MNASMNDTHNLGKGGGNANSFRDSLRSKVWKLTHVLRGWADISVLKLVSAVRSGAYNPPLRAKHSMSSSDGNTHKI